MAGVDRGADDGRWRGAERVWTRARVEEEAREPGVTGGVDGRWKMEGVGEYGWKMEGWNGGVDERCRDARRVWCGWKMKGHGGGVDGGLDGRCELGGPNGDASGGRETGVDGGADARWRGAKRVWTGVWMEDAGRGRGWKMEGREPGVDRGWMWVEKGCVRERGEGLQMEVRLGGSKADVG